MSARFFDRLAVLSVLALAGLAFGAGEQSVSKDWRDQWRAKRNAILDANPRIERDPTSMLVRFVPGTPEEMREKVREIVGARVIQTFDIVDGLEHWAIDGVVEDAIGLVEGAGQAIGVVEYAEPDFIYHLGATPNDTYYGLQWGLNNTGQNVGGDPGIAGADIDANLAWDVTTGSASFVVGMADSGIRLTHEDLAANLWVNPGEIPGNRVDDDGNGYVDDVNGWDFYNNDNNPTDDNGHGSHTAGIVGAVGNNGRGIAGVCWNVRLAALKIGNRRGSISLSAAINAIGYCVNKGIRVSNHSWGGGSYSSSMFSAITSARNAGHLIVAAAGNGGADGVGDNNDSAPFYPASYNLDNIIAVCATNNDDGLASFSNYGATSVDIGAPGVRIASCYNQSNTSYVYMDGTSMAAPHVTGVAALVWIVNPTWTYAQVRSKILSTARAIPALSGRCATGGVVNANNAVR
jgi:subtilisin family serine protease